MTTRSYLRKIVWESVEESVHLSLQDSTRCPQSVTDLPWIHLTYFYFIFLYLQNLISKYMLKFDEEHKNSKNKTQIRDWKPINLGRDLGRVCIYAILLLCICVHFTDISLFLSISMHILSLSIYKCFYGVWNPLFFPFCFFPLFFILP